MPQRLSIVLILLMCWTLPACAGAWLKEKGSGFASVSLSGNYYLDTANSTYIEYGLYHNLTVGADITLLRSRYGVQSGFATFFMRRPIGPTDGNTRWAYELGLGAGWVEGRVSPLVKTGLSYGRGITLFDKNGWLSVDSSVTWDVSYGYHLSKVETTAGLNFSDQLAGMMQLYVGEFSGSGFVVIAPSIIIKPKKTKLQFQVGAETEWGNTDNSALKIGLWRSF
ncbi:hypothetical protein [Sulfitobacter sp. S190]|uniref:hypothetical protein n=1 Tax=Sulfitobacter sp. S190 TaxID=2867022 RepID=UPI0021A94A4E|nr:hypothetical protein [Sulfitobacter sp. S190]UWR22034.1 hypothetical protein K3756_15350 [Sulfitobacter sp. S190]